MGIDFIGWVIIIMCNSSVLPVWAMLLGSPRDQPEEVHYNQLLWATHNSW